MTSRLRHMSVLVFATLAWVTIACVMAASAMAVSSYTEAAPAPGSTTPVSKPLISVKVADPAGIWMSGAQIKVDGVSRSPKLKWGPGNSYVVLSYQQTTALKNGTHTVYASVFTGAGRTSYTWTFTVDSAPTVGPLSPADGSVVNTQMPAITAGVTPNGAAVSSFAMTVDGVDVPATYDIAAKTISYTPVVGLTNDAEHTATLRVTDTGGASSTVAWRFGVQIYANMNDTAGCTECHEGFPAAHPMSDCEGCHEATGPYSAYWNMDPLYASAHSASYIAGDNCTYCHSTVYPNIPGHYASTASLHLSSADMSGCSCHVRDLTIEHNRYTTTTGDPITCLTCHLSEDPVVQAAMAEGKRACADCHPSAQAGSHDALHTLERTDACADCHGGESLTQVHLGSGLTCQTCHSSADPDVLAAIEGDLRDCSACHTAQGVDYHLNMGVHYAPQSTECGACHHGWGATPLQGPDVTRHPAGCTTCHNDTIELDGLTTACANCHLTNGTDYHLTLAADHTPQDAVSTDCARCHETTDVRDLHTTDGCATCHSSGCSDCHSMHNPAGGSLEQTTSCGRCHTTAGTNYHSGFDASHTFGAMDAGCQAQGCHTDLLVSAHAAFVGIDGRYPEYSDTCALCHLNEDPDRIPENASADCSSCHEVHGDLETVHTAATFTGYVDLVGAANPANPEMTCPDCHGSAEEIAQWVHSNGAGAGTTVNCGMCHTSQNLVTLHGSDCSACHAAGGPRESFADWNQSCQQGDCHPTLHPDARAGHDLVGCDNCHDHPDTFDFTLDRCGLCHTLNDLTPPSTTANIMAVYIGSANIVITPVDLPQIGGSGLAATYYRLDDGPVTTGTSLTASAPAGASQLHTIEYWSVDNAGNTETPKTRTFTVMNIVDTTPPTGTMSINGGAAYTLARYVAVDSNVTDSGTGVWQMRVDPGTGTFGAWMEYASTHSVYVPNSTGTKTVRVEYKDYAGNVRQLTDTIILDITPPVASSNALSTYTGSATITLSATDVGSGVGHIYYKLDGGTQTEGTTVNVAGPATGSVQHTLEYWAVDNAGRAGSHVTAAFAIIAPGAEVGTIAFAPYYAEDIDWYDWEVRNASGTLVASGNQFTPVTTVAVSAQAYTVTVDYVWYGEPVRTETFSALVDAPGKTVTIRFN